MLRQRIITALVLVAFLLGALTLDSAWPFALLTLLLIAAAAIRPRATTVMSTCAA